MYFYTLKTYKLLNIGTHVSVTCEIFCLFHMEWAIKDFIIFKTISHNRKN